MRSSGTHARSGLMVVLSLFVAAAVEVRATDLTVSSIEVNQAVQYGTTTLVGDQVTYVRATIGVSDSTVDVDNVDAVLRVFAGGVELPESPVMSLNGPIKAPRSPQRSELNHTVNFLLIVPQSNDVDFQVEVNPNRYVVETNYANNIGTASNFNFQCRGTVEVAYVPIDYRPGGNGGPPDATLIEPGIGDGFFRAIYKAEEWNYHKTPLPDLLWTQDVNNSDTALLNALRDIRLNQLPGAGYPVPTLIYGWLPGNPYSGNGRAIGIPGDAAFGNTQTVRHQRTMAHECGHLFGQVHNSRTIGTVGVDVEHHLWDTESLPVLHQSGQWDIMVGGQLTNTAYVDRTTYEAVEADSRLRCSSPSRLPAPVLRISGEFIHATGGLRLDPITRFEDGDTDATDPNGTISIVGYAMPGDERIYNLELPAPQPWESCAGPDEQGNVQMAASSPLYALLPESVEGRRIDRIQIIDVATGVVLAERARSASAPEARFTQSWVNGELNGRVTIAWSAADADGDALTTTLLYSPDAGQSWVPLVVNTPAQSFEFDTASVAYSRGANGRLRLVVTDGFNVTTVEDDDGGTMAGPTPPWTYLLTPNDDSVHLLGAPIAFHAAVWDKEDLMLSGGQVAWTSDVDGPLGTGLLLTRDNLSLGTHLITVTGTDTDGDSSSKQISITVANRQFSGIPCSEVKKFTGACSNGGALKAKLVLRTEAFDGATVIFSFDGSPRTTQVNGRRARVSVCCFTGVHQVSLDSPAGCAGPVTTTCP